MLNAGHATAVHTMRHEIGLMNHAECAGEPELPSETASVGAIGSGFGLMSALEEWEGK